MEDNFTELDSESIAHFDDVLNSAPDLAEQLSTTSPEDEQQEIMDQAFSQMVESDTSDIQLSMYKAKDTNPDQHARVVELAGRLNLPVGVVERNYDEFSKREKLDFARYDKILQDNPRVAEYLKDPENAKLAHDDIDGLKRVENVADEYTFASDLWNKFNAGVARMQSSIAKVPALAYDMALLPGNLIAKSVGAPQAQSPDWLRNNAVAKFYDEQAAGFSAQVSPEASGSVFAALEKGDKKRAAYIILNSVVENAPNQIAMIGMSIANPAIGLGFAGATQGAAVNAEGQAQKVDPASAATNAIFQGTVESAFESLGTFGILKQWENLIARQYGKEFSRDMMKDFAKTFASAVAGEANEEGLTSIAQDWSDYITGVNPEALKGIGQRWFDAAVIGGASGGGTISPTGAALGLSAAKATRQAMNDRNTYLALGDSIEAMRLRERLPEAARQFVDQVARDTGVENINIAPEALDQYFQSKNLDPITTAQSWGILNQYTTAKSAGTDVQIPLANWAKSVVGTEHFSALANDIKFHPGDLSVNEAKAQAEELKKQADAATQTEDEMQMIKAQVFEQLKATGLYDDKTARDYAHIYAERYKARADRRGLGESALDLFLNSGLVIRAGETPGAQGDLALDQAKFGKFIVRPDMPKTVRIPVVSGENISIEDARQFAMDNLRKTVLRDNGAKIEIAARGIGETAYKTEEMLEDIDGRISDLNDEEIRATTIAIKHIDKLLENAVFDKAEQVRKGKQGIMSYRRYYAPMRIDGKDYLFRLKTELRKGRGEEFYIEIGIENNGPKGLSVGVSQSERSNAFSGAEQPKDKSEGQSQPINGPSEISINDFAAQINGARSERVWFQSNQALTSQNSLGFYSKLIQTVEQKMGGAASPQDIKGMLKEIKPEEMKWLGLDEFMDGKEKIKKDELLAHLRANMLDIKEVTLSDEQSAVKPGDEIFAVFGDSSGDFMGNFAKRENAEKAAEQFARDHEDETFSVQKMEWDGETSLDDAQDLGDQKPPQYAQYVLPGGENYREVLLTMPPAELPDLKVEADPDKWSRREARPITFGDQKPEKNFILQYKVPDSDNNTLTIRHYPEREAGQFEPKIDDYDANQYLARKKHNTFEDAVADLEQALNEYRNKKRSRPDTYKSSHFDEVNILAHTRLTDRVDADGKKVLFVEEIQSDWHQAGRKRGYKGDQIAIDPKAIADVVAGKESESNPNAYRVVEYEGKFVTVDLNDFKDLDSVAETAEESARKYLEKRKRSERGSQVPDAPFKKTWHEFVLKRIIRMAAEEGYDRVAWTTGEQQAERFDLSKQVSKVELHKDAKTGQLFLYAEDLNGNKVLDKDLKSEDEIEDYVGKEVASKLIGKEWSQSKNSLGKPDGNQFKELEGDGLKVGGEGMKGFYDKILVDFANKFGKKYGARVGETSLGGAGGSSWSAFYTQKDAVSGRWQVIERETGKAIEQTFESDVEAYQMATRLDEQADSTKVHSLDITPQLKEAALNEGFSLFQGDPAQARGRIRFDADRKAIIELFEHKDLSTMLHESGHLWLEELIDDATTEGVQDQLKNDLDTLLEWFGIEARVKDGAVAIRAAIQVTHHEQMARGVEAYFMEGKAPNKSLRRVFSKFKVWLTAIYKNISGLNVILNDDVRAVMGRMLTASEAAVQVESEHFSLDPKALGLNPKEAEAYERAIRDAKIATEEYVARVVMADFDREKEKWFKERRAEIEKEVTAEIDAKPIYFAINAMKGGKVQGETKIKIDKKSFIAKFGKEAFDQLPKGVAAAKDGLHYGTVAEILGFRSGNDFVTQLLESPKREDAIKIETDRRMSNEHPSILVNGMMLEEAVAAYHNDNRAKLLQMELQHLANNNLPTLKKAIRRVARRVPTQAEVRAQAESMIGGMNIKDIRPIAFNRAEIRAAKRAGELLAKGEIDAAFEEKRKELLNYELYRAAKKANEQVQKSLEKFKAVRKSDEKLAKGRDINLVNAARAVLALYGIGPKDQTPMEYLEQVQKYDKPTFDSIAELVNAVTTDAGPYREVSFDNFMGMSDAVEALWSLSKQTREMEIDGIKRDVQEIQDELEARLGEIAKPANKPGYNRKATEFDKAKVGLMGMRAALRRVESWARAVDGGEAGPFTRYFVRPVMDATTRYRAAKKSLFEEYQKILEPISKTLTQDEIEAPELEYTFSGRAEILGALLHTGNSSNFEKLLLGRKWGAMNAEGTLDRSRWDAFIKRMHDTGKITKADYDTVQAIWDLLERVKPDAQRAHKKMYGYYFSEITADEITTPFGTYRGGYMPAIADAFMTEDAQIREDKEILEKNANSFMFPTTGRGFTKKRVDQYHAPLAIDLMRVPSHLDKVARFIHIEPTVKEIARIVTNKGFRAKLANLDSEVGAEMLMPWLQRTAQQKVEIPAQGRSGRFLDGIFRWARTRSSMMTMTWNIVNGVQNFTGIFPALTMVNRMHLAGAAWDLVRSPKEMAAMIGEKSDFMRINRIEKTAQEIAGETNEIVNNPSAFEKGREAAIRYGYLFQKITQGTMDMIAWTAGYNQAIEEGKSELEAVRYADSVVRLTQADMTPESVSAFEVGSAGKRLFTMFSGYFNTQANLLGTEFELARQMGGVKGGTRAAYVYLMAAAAPAISAAAIAQLFSGKLDSDDDGELIDDLLMLIFGSQAKYFTAMVPIAGPVAMGMTGAFTKSPNDDKISMSPAINTAERAAKGVSSVYQAITTGDKSKLRTADAFTAVGLVTGLPVGIVARPVSYQTKVEQGKATPKNPIDYARGIVTGR